MRIGRFPVACPSCGAFLKVKRIVCNQCGTAVEGDFELPVLLRLTPEDQEFVLNFVLANGSLKAVASEYGVSYPTVRNRLDALTERIRALDGNGEREDAGA